MTILGIGPLLAIVALIATAAMVVLERLAQYTISMPSPWEGFGFVVGIALVAIGVVFWLSSAVIVKRAFESHELATTGHSCCLAIRCTPALSCLLSRGSA